MNGSRSDDDVRFRMQVGYDQVELLGARWWHESLAATALAAKHARAAGTYGSSTDASRREALVKLLAAGGVVLAAGIGVVMCSSRRSHGVTVARRDSLALQRKKGVVVDDASVPFTTPNAAASSADGKPLDPAWLTGLASDLAPADAAWQPAYVPTLFQVFGGPGGDKFARQFQMVASPAMARAFAQGEAIRGLFEVAEEAWKWALVIDLPGADSVAFAAALQPAATAVFTFDNWPHPRGVVPAHLTLGAAVYHRGAFTGGARRDGRRPVAFVLDRNRLLPYADDPKVFDNRYRAKLPPAAFLRERGVERVLYVVPAGADAAELDDLNERFVEYRAAGITVQMLGLGDVREGKPEAAAGAAATRAHYWHGSPLHHFWFWNHYGWPSRPAPGPVERPPASSFGSTWSPTRRTTAFGPMSQLGTTPERREQPRSSGGSSGTGGSWGRSSGGFGG